MLASVQSEVTTSVDLYLRILLAIDCEVVDRQIIHSQEVAMGVCMCVCVCVHVDGYMCTHAFMGVFVVQAGVMSVGNCDCFSWLVLLSFQPLLKSSLAFIFESSVQ